MHRFNYILLAIILFGISFMGCDDETLSEPVYTITGTVTDSITGSPLDSALVYYYTSIASTFTDSVGQYRIEIDGDFPSPLSCSMAGYIAKEQITNQVDGQNKYDSVNFQLVPVS